MLYCNMQVSIYFYTSFILIKLQRNIGTFDVLREEDELVVIAFFKYFSNYLQISSKYSSTMIAVLCYQFVKLP